MFAIHWHSHLEGPLPTSGTEAGGRALDGYPLQGQVAVAGVDGATGWWFLDLGKKAVLLVGCGSVGSELAMRLISAGVGELTVSDPDTFSEENLYRHVLSVKDIGLLKTEALTREMALRYPWAEVTSWCNRLEELRDPTVLQRFDLVVIAIGSPTVERVFAEYCRQEDVGVPVIQLLAGGLRNRRPCDPGYARSERMLALRLREPRDAHARPHVEPELPETGAGRDAQPRGLRHAVPALQRGRVKLHGDDGRGFGRALSRG